MWIVWKVDGCQWLLERRQETDKSTQFSVCPLPVLVCYQTRQNSCVKNLRQTFDTSGSERMSDWSGSNNGLWNSTVIIIGGQAVDMDQNRTKSQAFDVLIPAGVYHQNIAVTDLLSCWHRRQAHLFANHTELGLPNEQQNNCPFLLRF